MSEYGWPDDHDDGHDFEQPDDGGLYHEDPLPALDEQMPDEHFWDDVHHDEPATPEDDAPFEHDASVDPTFDHDVAESHPAVEAATDDGYDLGTVGADPDALPEHGDEAVSLFPPVVDVGPLPEPVDGFPWIDTGSLGLVDPAAVHTPLEQTPSPQDLAEYAAADLPPGADPWAALAESEDPATSALARWWSAGQ